RRPVRIAIERYAPVLADDDGPRRGRQWPVARSDGAGISLLGPAERDPPGRRPDGPWRRSRLLGRAGSGPRPAAGRNALRRVAGDDQWRDLAWRPGDQRIGRG